MKKNILMIDDDEELCHEMVELLDSEGYAVEFTNDSFGGKKMIEAKPFDLILLDLKMPGMSGLDLLLWIKSQKIHSKIVIISGHPLIAKMVKKDPSAAEDRDAQIMQLADNIISKPFDVIEILVIIKNLIG